MKYEKMDMIVNLYDLPSSKEVYHKVLDQNIIIRRVRSYEKHVVSE